MKERYALLIPSFEKTGFFQKLNSVQFTQPVILHQHAFVSASTSQHRMIVKESSKDHKVGLQRSGNIPNSRYMKIRLMSIGNLDHLFFDTHTK